MMYEIVIEKSQKRKLRTLPENVQSRIKEACDELKENPQPTNHSKVKPLKGQQGLFRLRIGSYRVIMDRDKSSLRIWKVGDRSTVYETVDDHGTA